MTSAHPLRGQVGRSEATARDRHHTTMAQRFAQIVGALFLLVGVLGFIPGITQDYDEMTFAGHESDAELLGIFEVSILHNVVHLLFGVLAFAAARRFDWSRTYLLAGGLVYLALAVYGFAIDHDSDANFVPVNRADDWLHVALGVGMIALGLIASKMHEEARDRT